MAISNPIDFLENKSEEALTDIARRTGEVLCQNTLSKADRCVAEQIGRYLAMNAVDRVRCELSQAIRHAKHLPRDFAMMLAHDIDSVACPFLEVTQVFSDTDWQSLMLTVRKEARLSIARRSVLTESMALTLAEIGEMEVVETLLENPSAPIAETASLAILERFSTRQEIMDKLAQRTELLTQIAVKLVHLVSTAIRENLEKRYELQDFTDPIVVEAETSAILRTIDGMPAEELQPVAKMLQHDGILKPNLLLAALRDGKTDFLVAALAVQARRDIKHVKRVLDCAKLADIKYLLKDAHIPGPLHINFWKEIERVRLRTPF